jgi:dephospho-CoA kinase
LARADDVIVNDNGLDALERQVDKLHLQYLNQAAGV